MENGFAAQSATLLAKISALANLLATPKDQLFKVSYRKHRQVYACVYVCVIVCVCVCVIVCVHVSFVRSAL